MTGMSRIFIVLLTVTASVSPLLTCLYLWQVKEWRRDRLLDHLRREGTLETALGKTRVAVGGAWLILGLLLQLGIVAGWSIPWSARLLDVWILMLPGLLTVVGLIQLGLKKQPMPVWTKKALMALAVVIIIDTVLCTLFVGLTMEAMDNVGNAIVTHPLLWLTIMIPYMQWLMGALGLTVLWPLDHYLKRRVMSRAGNLRKAHPTMTVIGITGSVGKTTTKELLAHILKARGARATPIHVNTEMGVAAWLSKILRDEPPTSEKILIVEMGAYRQGEISLLCSIAQPTMGIVTYVGTQHLSLFGSREAIVQAKGELLEALSEHDHAFLNRDNDAFEALKKRCRCPVTTVGTDHLSDVSATDIEETGNGMRFQALETTFEIPLAGTHNITSVLLAVAAARHLKIPPSEIAASLRTVKPIASTFEVRTEGSITILNDTYNSSPDSARAAIDWAALQPHSRKILLMEGIIELGSLEEEVHLALAKRASEIFDRAFIRDPHFLPYFVQGGFGDRAMPASALQQPIDHGSLLVCIGRIPQSTLKRFMPAPMPQPAQ